MIKETPKTKSDFQTFSDFAIDNKDMLMLFADPRTDEIMVCFGGLNTFGRFPTRDMSEGVVFNALRQSQFASAMPYLTDLFAEITGITTDNNGGNEIHQFLGGSIRAIGEKRKVGKSKLETKDAKIKRSKKGS